MAGSTLIHEVEEEKLEALAADVEAVDGFTHLDLDRVQTMDFQTMLADSGASWADGSPVVLNEESGIAVFKVAKTGLGFLCANSLDLDETQAADLMKIKEFVAAHGTDHIYELAAF